MMLVEEARLAGRKITKYFPMLPLLAEHYCATSATHTAGTTDYPNDFDFRRDYSDDDLLKRAQVIPLAFEPAKVEAIAILDM